MTLPSDWKMGKCLEWYTEVAFQGRPRKSPDFLIRNIQCYFELCINHPYGYQHQQHELYLKPKMSPPTKLESFSVKIYSDYITIDKLNITNAKFCDFSQCLLRISNDTIVNRGGYLTSGCFIRFCFVFGNEVGLLLPLETKTDEKSSQVDLMFMQTETEYLSLDFEKLLKTGDHSDVQLQCNGGNISAHRAVLAARSKVFSDIFKGNSGEIQNGLVNFTTTEVSVMKLCLEFIYEGKISNLPVEMAANLYVLGHALKIPSLSKMCADLMISDVSQDNYIPNLVLANKYDDDYLKCNLIDYISHHADLLKTKK